MVVPTPQNDEEASYLAIAVLRELLSLLTRKNVITDSEIDGMLVAVANGLAKENNFASQRASRFLAEWMRSQS